MVGTIARKELVEMTRDGRFRGAAIVVVVLLFAALITGWRHWRDTSALHAAAARATRADWLAQPAKNPHTAAHYGIYAFKPKPPLALVDRGVDSYVGSYTLLEAHRQNEFRGRPAQDATPAARFGEWTAASVLQLLVPLLIVMLAFPAFAGERDRGTLRQLASLGVPPPQLAMGKALGSAAALGLLLVPATILGALGLVLAGGEADLDHMSTLPRVALLTGGYLLYFALFLALALVISARARSARSALVLLLAFWSANALAAPPLAASIARALHPTPTAMGFSLGVERALLTDPHGLGNAQRAAQFRDSVLRAYGVTHVDSLPVNFAGLTLEEGERHGARVFDAQYGALHEQWRAQERVRAALAIGAPLLAIRALSMAIAGTDFEQHRDFQMAAERYRRDLVQRMNRGVTAGSRSADGLRTSADSTLWATVPPFVYRMPSVRAVLANQWGNLSVLAAWAVMSLAAVWWSVRRLPISPSESR